MPAAHLVSRRIFLQGLTASLLLGAPATKTPQVEYVCTDASINVFRTLHRRKTLAQTVKSENPSFLALDKTGKLLFAVNEISEYKGLPCGSVECFAVEPASGRLTFISRRALSLSATMPRSLAIAPDGKYLVVAAYGGGAYNVLRIQPDGQLGPVTQVIKEIGSSVRPQEQSCAHPHSVVFHPSGKFLFSTDSGCDRINVFNFEFGRLYRLHRSDAAPGSGPAQIDINANGSLLHIGHQFNSTIAHYRFNASTASLRLRTIQYS